MVIDSLMITAPIDTMEMRNSVTLDIPCTVLHTDLDEEMIMMLCEELAESMAKVETKS